MSSEGFSTLEKNALVWSRWAMLFIRCDSLLQIVIAGSLLPRFFKFELDGLGMAARC